MQKTKGGVEKGLFFNERLTAVMRIFLDCPLTLVEAPMGYGKTTFVRECLAQLGGEVFWLKTHSSDIRSFWSSFCRQLCNVDQEGASSLEALGFPTDSMEQQEALRLIEAMHFKANSVLVVDDYHLVANLETNQFFEHLITEDIKDLNIVLIGRHSGMQCIEELKLKGYLLHIKKEAFELSAADIKAYYQLCGLRITSAKANELYTLTEGWISALYLMLLDYRENNTLGHARDIDKLIQNAIYRHFTEELKHLMLSVCLFNGFTVKQAQFMSQNQLAEMLLKEVAEKNAFVTYDAIGKSFQIHSIFTNFLQEELESKGMQLDMYQRAAQWFLACGDLNVAFQYFYMCQDFEPIFRALDKQLNYSYNKELIVKICQECPDSIKAKYPFALLVLAFELYTFNEMELFGAICETFTNQVHGNIATPSPPDLPNPPNSPDSLSPPDPVTSPDLPDLPNSPDSLECQWEKRHLLGEFELLMSFTQFNDIRSMAPHFIKAAELLQTPSRLLPQNGIWTFGSPSILYMFYRESGKLDDALEALFEVLPLYSQATGGNAYAGEYCMKAEQYLYRGDLENAQITSHQALYRAKSKNQLSNTLCVRFTMARIALINGQFLEAADQYKKMRTEIEAAKEYLLFHTLEICEGYVYALLSKPNKIPEWLLARDYVSDKLLFPNYAMLNIVRGRALLVRGDFHRVIGCMEEFMGIASVFPNLLGQIYTCIYVAGAYHKLFRQKDALNAVVHALDLGMPDQLYLPFVENCDFIEPLLAEIRSSSIHQRHIDVILGQYKSYKSALVAIEKSHFSDQRPKLTDREMEISLLVAQGLSNKEIAAKLYITVNTVKMALKGIYNKLSINNRSLIKSCLESSQTHTS